MSYTLLYIFLAFLIIRKLWDMERPTFRQDKLVEKTRVSRVIYDNSPLNIRALRKQLEISERLNCHSNIIECDSDEDCVNVCAGKNSRCLNRFCGYSSPHGNVCQNGGQPVSQFDFGEFHFLRCLCSAEYLGRFCEIPNLMIAPTH